MVSSTTSTPLDGIEALIFDLMGTCTNWHRSISLALSEHASVVPVSLAEDLAFSWRERFFAKAHAYSRDENIDVMPSIDGIHRETLLEMLSEHDISIPSTEGIEALVKAWHYQLGWEDSSPGLKRLKKRFMTSVLANGTTRLQLDLVRTADLPFDLLLSSQLLKSVKPRPIMYESALSLLGLPPSRVAMVAAHAYDCAAAKEVGFRTVYIYRGTEDRDLDMKEVEKSVDMFIGEGGLQALADCLRC